MNFEVFLKVHVTSFVILFGVNIKVTCANLAGIFFSWLRYNYINKKQYYCFYTCNMKNGSQSTRNQKVVINYFSDVLTACL